MKRILVFNDGLEMGGTEKLLVSLLNHLADEKQCHVTLLLPCRSDKNILLDEISPSVKIKYLYKESISYTRRKIEENLLIFFPVIYIFFKRLRLSDFDRVICFKESVYARLFGRINKPKILWIHNILYKRQYSISSFRERISVWLNRRQIRLTEKSYTKFEKVACVSDACKRSYIDVIYGKKAPGQSIEVIYNAVDLSAVALKSKDTINLLPQDRINFILITRLSPEKRTDRLINAVQKLKENGYFFHAYILGQGLDSEEMKKNLNEREISDRITLMGRVDNPYPYILQSNWLLCVSERESFSLTILEAMSLKTPVITTDCGGPGDIIERGKYGVLVENSTEGVYKGMKMVLDDRTLSVKYSNHLDEAVRRFDYQQWLCKIDSLLNL